MTYVLRSKQTCILNLVFTEAVYYADFNRWQSTTFWMHDSHKLFRVIEANILFDTGF